MDGNGLSTALPGRRVRFRDVKPYAVPAALDELRGPRHGMVQLPHSAFWAPGGGDIDIDAPGGIEMAYQAVIAEGEVADQVAVLNTERLVEVWARLNLDPRVRKLWEDRFPELTAQPAA